MAAPDNIVIGTPPRVENGRLIAWNEWLPVLGVEPEEITVFEKDTHLPRILVKHGFFSSTSKVRKATPSKGQLPFVRDLERPELTEIKIGHKRVWLIVGDVN